MLEDVVVVVGRCGERGAERSHATLRAAFSSSSWMSVW